MIACVFEFTTTNGSIHVKLHRQLSTIEHAYIYVTWATYTEVLTKVKKLKYY